MTLTLVYSRSTIARIVEEYVLDPSTRVMVDVSSTEVYITPPGGEIALRAISPFALARKIVLQAERTLLFLFSSAPRATS